jgi:hypothetical protein
MTTELLLLVHWNSYKEAAVIAGTVCGTRVKVSPRPNVKLYSLKDRDVK